MLLSLPYKAPPVSSSKKKAAIKSYLYKKPARVLQQVIKENKTNKQVLTATRATKKPPLSPKNVAINKMEKPTQVEQQKLTNAQVNTVKAVKKFDARKQLADFRSQLNRQILQEEFSKFNRPRNLSGMNDLPQPVPHAKVRENEIIKKEKATTNYASDIAIIKLDDGRCILKQDLSTVSMAGITAVSGFNCGRTKMEKAFSAHMDKALKKLGKK